MLCEEWSEKERVFVGKLMRENRRQVFVIEPLLGQQLVFGRGGPLVDRLGVAHDKIWLFRGGLRAKWTHRCGLSLSLRGGWPG